MMGERFINIAQVRSNLNGRTEEQLTHLMSKAWRRGWDLDYDKISLFPGQTKSRIKGSEIAEVVQAEIATVIDSWRFGRQNLMDRFMAFMSFSN